MDLMALGGLERGRVDLASLSDYLPFLPFRLTFRLTQTIIPRCFQSQLFIHPFLHTHILGSRGGDKTSFETYIWNYSSHYPLSLGNLGGPSVVLHP